MAQTGTLSVGLAARVARPAFVNVNLYGARGGFIGSTSIDRENALEVFYRLGRFLLIKLPEAEEEGDV